MFNSNSFLNLLENLLVHIQLAGNTQVAYSDAAKPWQLGFQDPASPTMEGIINFHHDLMFFIVAISAFVFWLLFRCIYLFAVSPEEAKVPTSGEGKLASAKLLSEGIYHNTFIEIVWTVVPALILAIIAVPSFALLYSLEELVEPNLTLKVTGNQWYWSYEYSNCRNPDIAEHIDGKKFDSYMIPTEDLEEGNLRLLEVDNRVLLPVKTHVSIIVTASDVLHCWAVPSLGVKVDACPGRLNQTSVFIKREGVFYGQCSEICGVNHGFMPIVVEGVSMYDFLFRSYVDNLLTIVEDDPDLEGFEMDTTLKSNSSTLLNLLKTTRS
jgi:cytochrome c oxidase subunit 2